MDWSTVDVHYLSEAFWGARLWNFDMKETKQMAPLYVHIWGNVGNFEWLMSEIKEGNLKNEMEVGGFEPWSARWESRMNFELKSKKNLHKKICYL